MLPLSRKSQISRIAFWGLLFLVVALSLSAGVSLAMGLIIGIFFYNPYPAPSKKVTKYLLQISIVGLGFGMNINQVMQAGKDGFTFTLITIGFALGLGFLLGRLLKVQHIIAYLISCGTAICGGSAIGAISQVLKADEKEISVSIGIIFMLNAVALFIFPPIGHWAGLTEQQFGIWSAIAIHDTSSVVGAASKYGNNALMIATTIKLARALWIVPLVVLTSFLFKIKGNVYSLPWFIVFFVIASIVATKFAIPVYIKDGIVHLAKTGFSITLFLIGCGISVDAIKKVGVRPLVMGVVLWVVILTATLFIVKKY
ncbi:MAG: putative sulfate exporter family transporter [Bacteroidota bacterium]